MNNKNDKKIPELNKVQQEILNLAVDLSKKNGDSVINNFDDIVKTMKKASEYQSAENSFSTL